MPRKSALKVFRTPIGFHDAYVAAPSRKAALQAWGAESDLFARGAAELVEDPDLAREPLQHPGTVIRRPRGTMAEHIAALPDDAPPPPATPPQPRRAARNRPKPARTALDAAERAVETVRQRQAHERDELARRQAALDRERSSQGDRHARELASASDELAAARSRYERAMRQWRG